MTRRLLPALAALAVALAACRSPEQKLADRRRDLRGRLDDLYEEYTEDARDGRDRQGGSEGNIVGRLLGEMDRSVFEQQCLAVGRGERPFAPSGRLEAFLRENEGGCADAADLELEIRELERKVASR